MITFQTILHLFINTCLHIITDYKFTLKYSRSHISDDYALSEPTVPEHLKTRIKHYKDAYYNSSIQKCKLFRII
ncbi:hypothetical protein Smp_193650 [Schistosoma mansoni]|uniref:hypothetical protein n=1 Tax=Schistosoma mansoni TaxID=6183 RepID=UPI00022C8714|nr:hypothetical protein Smp_193650 [Schistosoma mansoni]|eukprot:XP_018644619.1 hypothetical protein Smp_193650 [Schistosoma mansoni]